MLLIASYSALYCSVMLRGQYYTDWQSTNISMTHDWTHCCSNELRTVSSDVQSVIDDLLATIDTRENESGVNKLSPTAATARAPSRADSDSPER